MRPYDQSPAIGADTVVATSRAGRRHQSPAIGTDTATGTKRTRPRDESPAIGADKGTGTNRVAQTASVPEPGIGLLLALGLVVLLGFRKKLRVPNALFKP